MKYLRLVFASFVIVGIPAGNAAPSVKSTLVTFPPAAAKKLGPIDRLVVTVTCGGISDIANIPELYDLAIEYKIPTQVTLEAEPRLGAAAVDLARWSNVVRAHSDDDGCFRVDVSAEGRSAAAHWTDQDLGLRK